MANLRAIDRLAYEGFKGNKQLPRLAPMAAASLFDC